MFRAKILAAAFLGAALASTGCSSSRTLSSPVAFEPHSLHFKTLPLDTHAEMKPQVSGESGSTKFLGLGEEATVGKAIQDALKKSPGASLLMAPVVQEERLNLLLISVRKVSVTGIPVEFKKGAP